MNITIVMVVRDEGYFLPLSLNNALKHADSVYVLDTGSKDSTMSVLQFYKGIVGERLQFEQRDFGGRFRFDNMATIDTRKGGSIATGAYREMDARNYALEQAESMFDPDWILRMDADESFAPHLFDVMRNEKEKVSIGFSTELPISHTPTMLNRTPAHMTDWCGVRLHDPHLFAWNRRKTKVRWAHPENSHVVLVGPNYGSLATARLISNPVHFHYHRCFGPKSIYTFLYWARMFKANENGEQLSIGYGTTDLFDNQAFTRETMYDIAVYREHMPHLFAVDGRFIVPAIVSRTFRSHGLVIDGDLIDSEIRKAWEDFLIYGA